MRYFHKKIKPHTLFKSNPAEAHIRGFTYRIQYTKLSLLCQ